MSTGVFVCRNEDVTEDAPAVASHPRKRMGIRTAVMESIEAAVGLAKFLVQQPLKSAPAMVSYGIMVPARRRRIPMDVEAMVALWAEKVPKLALAHTIDERDAAEAGIDDLLMPLLKCPVAELREFYKKLLERLKADPAVPWFLWRAFEAWHELFVKDAPDEKVKHLKKKLAGDIADMVEEKVKPDIREAMVRALMWRDPETLREVKAALDEAEETGAKPRVKGRQSCLFLTVPRGRGRRPAEVML